MKQDDAVTTHRRANGHAAPRWVAWFQVVVGTSIATLWPVLLVSRQVPEVEAGERGIWFHIVAELVTALLLLVGGVLSLKRLPAAPLSLVALGALLYTSIASAGYYADSGDWAVVTMFGLLLLVTLAAIAATLRASRRTQADERRGRDPAIGSVTSPGNH